MHPATLEGRETREAGAAAILGAWGVGPRFPSRARCRVRRGMPNYAMQPHWGMRHSQRRSIIHPVAHRGWKSNTILSAHDYRKVEADAKDCPTVV